MRKANLEKLGLAAIVLVAIIPRITHLSSSLWYDETFASWNKLDFSLNGLLWMAYDTHPAFYNTLMLLWNHVFGESEISLRTIPYVCSLAAIMLSAKIARYILGGSSALLVAILMALSGASVYFAQEARSYSLDVLMFLLMVYFLLRYAYSARTKDLKWFFLFSIGCAASHLITMFIVLCFMAALVWQAADSRTVLGMFRFVLLQVALAVPFYFLIVLMGFFTSEHDYFGSTIVRQFYASDAAQLFSFFFFGYGGLNNYPAFHWIASSAFLVGTIVILRDAQRGPRELNAASPSASNYTFSFPGMEKLFLLVSSLGLTASLTVGCSRFYLPPSFFLTLVPAERHAELMGNMVHLLSRTALLYLAGYASVTVLWFVLSERGLASRFTLTWRKIRPRNEFGISGTVAAVAVFPILAVFMMMAMNRFRPIYEYRYMLVLLPFAVLGVSAAVSRVPFQVSRIGCTAFLLFLQFYSLTQQRTTYDLLKPDYKSALKYLQESGWSKFPVTGTALWETQNVEAYYSRREGYPRLNFVPVSRAVTLPRFSVLVPDRNPPNQARFPNFAELMKAVHPTQVSFAGITLYEVERSP